MREEFNYNGKSNLEINNMIYVLNGEWTEECVEWVSSGSVDLEGGYYSCLRKKMVLLKA